MQDASLSLCMHLLQWVVANVDAKHAHLTTFNSTKACESVAQKVSSWQSQHDLVAQRPRCARQRRKIHLN